MLKKWIKNALIILAVILFASYQSTIHRQHTLDTTISDHWILVERQLMSQFAIKRNLSAPHQELIAKQQRQYRRAATQNEKVRIALDQLQMLERILASSTLAPRIKDRLLHAKKSLKAELDEHLHHIEARNQFVTTPPYKWIVPYLNITPISSPLLNEDPS